MFAFPPYLQWIQAEEAKAPSASVPLCVPPEQLRRLAPSIASAVLEQRPVTALDAYLVKQELHGHLGDRYAEALLDELISAFPERVQARDYRRAYQEARDAWLREG